jgi:hypothetical protein
MFILHGWLRSGNPTAGRGGVEFLTEALALSRLPLLAPESDYFRGAARRNSLMNRA